MLFVSTKMLRCKGAGKPRLTDEQDYLTDRIICFLAEVNFVKKFESCTQYCLLYDSLFIDKVYFNYWRAQITAGNADL